MDLQEFKTTYFLFDPEPFGRIFAFVDFGNVRPWAKELWPEENKFRFSTEIDIAKIKDICSWVNTAQSFFYYGYFARDTQLPEGEKDPRHNNSVFRIDKARKNGFEVATKETKMIPQYDENGKFVGKFPKCNFDVEIGRDMLIDDKNGAESFVLWSGDSDFTDPIKQLLSDGKKVVLFATARRVSSELNALTKNGLFIFDIQKIKEFISWKRELSP